MGHALFYHLTRSAPEDLVRLLVGRALEAGWRVAVRGTDRARLERLDAALWLVPEDGFLPHAMAGGAQDADQPVLLTTHGALPNAARAVLALDGADVTPAEVAMLERAWIVFDGSDPAAVDRARDQWRRLTGDGQGAEYWSEETGRWQMKTARNRPGA